MTWNNENISVSVSSTHTHTHTHTHKLFFFFFQYWGLNLGPSPGATPPALYCDEFFEIGSISQAGFEPWSFWSLPLSVAITKFSAINCVWEHILWIELPHPRSCQKWHRGLHPFFQVGNVTGYPSCRLLDRLGEVCVKSQQELVPNHVSLSSLLQGLILGTFPSRPPFS
jgi:hypothetical protein